MIIHSMYIQVIEDYETIKRKIHIPRSLYNIQELLFDEKIQTLNKLHDAVEQ